MFTDSFKNIIYDYLKFYNLESQYDGLFISTNIMPYVCILRDIEDDAFSLEYNRGFKSENFVPFNDIESIKIFTGENIFKDAYDYNAWGLFVKFNTSEELINVLIAKHNST